MGLPRREALRIKADFWPNAYNALRPRSWNIKRPFEQGAGRHVFREAQ